MIKMYMDLFYIRKFQYQNDKNDFIDKTLKINYLKISKTHY